MNYVNQMQDKIVSALHSIVEAWELEWVEIFGGPAAGTVRVMQHGGFRTLLKIEYEFQPERYRLLIYRDGRHILGRCNIDYDDGLLIEEILAEFRNLSAEALLDPPQSYTASRQSLTSFRLSLSRSLEQHV
jgi:hypothetical protein